MFHLHLKTTLSETPTTQQRFLDDEVDRSRRTPRRHTIGLRRRRGGSVVVVAALSIVALTGMCALAVDYGMLVSDANRLQRACDASALAGANYLKVTGNDQVDVANARAAAAAMMAQHKISGFDSNAITFNATWNKITVPAQTTRNYFFAGVFKTLAPANANATSSNSGTVFRHAAAGRKALKGVPGVAPLAITVEDYLLYKNAQQFENVLIDNNRQNFIPTTMTAIDLRLDGSGKSGAVFQSDLTNGTPGTTVIGQPVQSALNADLNSQGAKLERAMNDRFARAAGAPWNDTGNTYTFPNYPSDDPRIVTLMVADSHLADNNNPVLTARFFVAVYVDRVRSIGNGSTFMRMRILPTSGYSSDRTDIVVGDDNTPFSGPSVVGLSD